MHRLRCSCGSGFFVQSYGFPDICAAWLGNGQRNGVLAAVRSRQHDRTAAQYLCVTGSYRFCDGCAYCGCICFHRSYSKIVAGTCRHIRHATPVSAGHFCRDTVYFSVGHYQVELYTSVKSPDAEALVEGALSGLCWEKSETYLDSERLYQILYEIEV